MGERLRVKPLHRSALERDLWWCFSLLIIVAAFCTFGFATDPYFFWHDDNQTQHVAGSLEIGRSYLAGHVPLLSTSSWYASGLGPEYQYGIFQPWVVLSDVLAASAASLPLGATAALLAMMHLLVAAVGGYLLGRSYRLVRPLAAVVAISATLNGWLIQWGATNWFPVLTSAVWFPWVWWSLRVALRERPPRWAPLMVAISVAMLVNAGWPYSDLGLVIIVLLNLAIPLRSHFKAGPAYVGLVAGAAFSAPPIMLLLSSLSVTDRPMGAASAHVWKVPLSSLIGIISPVHYTTWLTLDSLKARTNLDYLGALVPAAGAVAALLFNRRRFLRRYWREIAALLVCTFLMMMPGAEPFRFSFRWMALWHLLLAVVGMCGLQLALRRRGWSVPLFVMGLIGLFLALNRAKGLAGAGLYGTGVFVLALVATSLEFRFRKAAVVALVLVALFNSTAIYWLTYHDEDVPLWRFGDYLRDSSPFSPDKLYLSVYTGQQIFGFNRMVDSRVAGSKLFRPGNAPLYAGLHFINGYSPLLPRPLHTLLRMEHIGGVEGPERALQFESGPHALLGHYGVDGIVGFRSELLPLVRTGAWRPVAEEGPDMLIERVRPVGAPARVAWQVMSLPTDEAVFDWILGRKDPAMPMIVTGQAPRELCRRALLESAANSGNGSHALVDTSACETPSLIVFTRMWQNGFRATFAGQTAEVVEVDATMPAVIVPPHARGEVVLEYRPRELVVGVVIAACGLLLLAAYAVISARRTRREPTESRV
jgi:hypothetical protein